LLVQVPERGLGRPLLIGLLQGLEHALLRGLLQVLLRALGRGLERWLLRGLNRGAVLGAGAVPEAGAVAVQ
jgi:hypothetical protein